MFTLASAVANEFSTDRDYSSLPLSQLYTVTRPPSPAVHMVPSSMKVIFQFSTIDTSYVITLLALDLSDLDRGIEIPYPYHGVQ